MSSSPYTDEEVRAAGEAVRLRIAEEEKAKARNLISARSREEAPNRFEALQLESRTGVPVDTVERNLPEVRSMDTANGLDPNRVATSPATSNLLSGPLAPMAMKEIAESRTKNVRPTLAPLWSQPSEVTSPVAQAGYGDVASTSLDRGSYIVDVGLYGSRILNGTASPMDRIRFAELRRQGAPVVPDLPGYADDVLGMLVEQAPIMGSVLSYAGVGAATGAAIGATAFGAGAGPGALLGAGGGTFVGAFNLEAGNALAEVMDAADELKASEGIEISEDVLHWTARFVGLVNAGIEVTGWGIVSRVFGLSALVKGLSRDAVKQILKSKTLRPHLKKLAKRVATAGAVGSVEEFSQEAVNVAATHFIISNAKGEDLVQKPSRETWERLFKAWAAGFIVSSFYGAPAHAVMAGIENVSANRIARRKEGILDKLVEFVGNSNLPKADAARFKEYLQKVIEEGGGDPNMYIDARSVAAYFEANEIELSELAEAIPDVFAQLPEALAAGVDLVIPIADYATYLSEHHEGLKAHVRHGLNAPSPAEVGENEAQAESDLGEALTNLDEEEAAAASATPGERIAQAYLQKLVSEGVYSPADAHQHSQVLGAFMEERIQRRIREESDRLGRELTSEEVEAITERLVAQAEAVAVEGWGALDVPARPTFEQALERIDMNTLLDEIRSGVTPEVKGMSRTPILNEIRRQGGVATVHQTAGGWVQSPLAAELEALGVTPKTNPGLFRDPRNRAKWSQAKRQEVPAPKADFDSFDWTDNELLRGPTDDFGRPTDFDDLYDAIREELAGTPRRTEAESQKIVDFQIPREQLSAILDQLGVDLETTTNEEIIEMLRQQFQVDEAVEADAPGELDDGSELFQKAKLEDQIPGLKGILPYLSESEKAKLRKDTGRRLVSIFQEMPDATELASLAFAGRAKRGWYRDSAKALVDIFGIDDAPRFAALLAALSPQTSVEVNALNALNVWVNWVKAGRPTGKKAILRVMGDSVLGDKGIESVLGAWRNNSIRALSSKDPGSLVISGPKVNSFMLNLRGFVDEVTNDAWMANVLGVDQEIFSGAINVAGTDAGKGPGYLAASALIRKAADIVSRRTGENWSPSEVQETVWSWAKALLEQRLSKDEARSALKLVREQGGPDVLRLADTPDFAVLFANGIYRKILEAGGLGEAAEFAARSGQAARRARGRGRGPGGQTPGIAKDRFEADLRRAAKRLDRLAEARAAAKAAKTLEQAAVLRVDKPSLPGVWVDFSGAGTVEAVLEGVEGVGATEYKPEIIAQYNEAHGTNYEAADVNEVDPADIAAAKPTLYEASPVCKNFSKAKALAQADELDRKSAETVANVIRVAEPPLVVVENVPKYADTALFKLITDALDEKGYTWEVVIHDAADYGAVQTRKRMILRAVKDGKLPARPKEQAPGDWFTAVEDLLDAAPDATIPPVEMGRLREMESRGKLDFDKPIITMGGSAFRGSWAASNAGGPSPTLKASNEVPRIIMPDGRVKRVTPRMMARLMGLPDSYPVPENKRLAKTVLGNGVHGATTRALIQPLVDQVTPQAATTLEQSPVPDAERPLGGVFYSALGRALRTSKQRKMTVQQLRGLLKKERVKEEEIVWTGLDEFLEGLDPKDKIDLGLLLDNISLVQVEEVVLGKSKMDELPDERALWDDLNDPVGWKMPDLDSAEARDVDAPAPYKDIVGESDGEEFKYRVYLWEEGQDVWVRRSPDDPGQTALLEIVPDAEFPGTLIDAAVQTILKDLESRLSPEREKFVGEPKFDSPSYQLPGGKDYRETLITLPPIHHTADIEARIDSLEKGKEFAEGADWDEMDAEVQRLKALRKQDRLFTGGHMGGVAPNILVHVRWNVRTGPNGEKILFIEEIQDDWAKAGRKSGYAGAFPQEVVDAAVAGGMTEEAAVADVRHLMEEPLDAEGRPTMDEWARLISATEYSSIDLNEVFHDRRDRGVPDRPFKTSGASTMLAFKRMVAYAAKNGFDSVAWTTGKVQVERYESALRQSVDEIEWEPGRVSAGGIGSAAGWARPSHVSFIKDGEVVLDMDVVTETGLVLTTSTGGEDAIGGPIEAVVGKDIASQILDSEEGSVSEENLTIGGKGFEDIYDKTLVKGANKLGKPFGTKVGRIDVGTAPGRYVPEGLDQTFRYEVHLESEHGDTFYDSYETMDEAQFAAASYRTDMPEGQWSVIDSESTKEGQGTPVHNLPITDKLRASVAAEGFSLFQAAAGGPRGQIRFDAEMENIVIRFTEARDLSTGLHELAHLFLEMIMQDVTLSELNRGGAAGAELAKDMEAILNFLGVSSLEEIETEHHEKWARAFEAYLREGKAPSVELQSAFKRFKAWLIQIYKSLRQLNVELSPEIREVFDRMLASEEQIAQARDADIRMQPRFESAEVAGMTDGEFAEYEASYDRWMSPAQERTLRAALAEKKREGTKVWKQNYAKMRAEVEADINSQPVYRLRHWLQHGKFLDEETPEDLEHVRLDRDILKKRYGRAILKALGGAGKYGMWQKDGIGPDAMADLFGFVSGDALVRALQQSINRDQAIDEETSRRMKEVYGDMLNDGSLAELALDELESDEKGNFLSRELRVLAKKAGAPGTPQAVSKKIAKRMIAQKRIRDLRADIFRRAEQRAAREVLDAVDAQNWQEAHAASMRQLLSHFLVLEATQRKEQTTKWHLYLRTFDDKKKIERIGKAGGDHLQQIFNLLDRFDFRKISNKEADRRQRLAEWITEKEAEDETAEYVIDDRLRDEAFRSPWRNLTVEELESVVDAVKNIEHMAMLKNKLLLAKDKREFDAKAELAAETIERNRRSAKPIPKEHHLKETAKDLAGSYFASHRKIASLVEEMDGRELGGPLFDMILRPMDEQSSWETEERVKSAERLHELIKLYTDIPLFGSEKAKQVATKLTLGFVDRVRPELSLPKLVPGTADIHLSKIGRIVAVLNTGNAGNMQRLRDGYGWSPEDIQAIRNSLSKEDMDFVQGVWDFIDEYWELVAAKQKRVTGVAPKRVTRQPFTTIHGTYAGGYFPIADDPNQTARAYGNVLAETAKETMRGFRAASTTLRGHTKARADKVMGKKLRLDFGVIFEHVNGVIHDLAWHEWLIDTNRLLRDERISQAIIQGYGNPVYRNLINAVRDIAAGDVAAEKGWEQAVNWLRTGGSIAAMAHNAMTAALQPFGIFQSWQMIGVEWVAKGIGKWWRGPEQIQGTVEWIHSVDSFMKNRALTMQREIREVQLSAREGGGPSRFKDSLFYFIVKTQMLVDIPTWLGAYEKEMEIGSGDHDRAVAMARRTVKDTQGSGEISDLSAIQRGSPLLKAWTAFYHFFNTTMNLTAQSYRSTDFKQPLEVGRFAADMVLLYSFPAFLSDLMRRAIMDNWDEDESWGEMVIRSHAGYALGTLVGPRELSGIASGFTDYEGPAGTRFFSAISKLSVQVGQGEVDAASIRALNAAGGIVFHYPAISFQRIVEGALAISAGETQNPVRLLTGPTREQRQ